MKEFMWNKIPEKDYFYFKSNRIFSLLHSFYDYYPQMNCIYLSTKYNGDVNAIFEKINRKLNNPIEIDISFYNIFVELRQRIYKDLFYGSVDDFCYIVQKRKDFYLLYKVEFNNLKERNKIKKKLKEYREGDFTTPANKYFSDLFNKSLVLK